MATEEELKAAMALDAEEDDSSGEEEAMTEEAPVELLVTSRAKRATAGNRMSSMVAEIAEDDDLELLFAEDDDEGPDEEFEEDVDDGGSDNNFGDSSDEEDRAPATGAEDLDGEKEIEKQAKEERKRKRKAQQALTRPSKKIKHLPMPGSAAAPAPSKPKKKVERLSWIPALGEATRSSRRAATTLQSDMLRTRIEAREEDRKLQAHKLEAAARRRAAARAKIMSQEEHFAEAAQVEKENKKNLNRWEALERERREEQEARLAALQNRQLTGPVISFWSGRARWLGEKLSAVGVAKIKEVEQKEVLRAEKEKEREEKQKQRDEKERQREAERKAAGIEDIPMDSTEPNATQDQSEPVALSESEAIQTGRQHSTSDSHQHDQPDVSQQDRNSDTAARRSMSVELAVRPKSSAGPGNAYPAPIQSLEQATDEPSQPPSHQDTTQAKSQDGTPSIALETRPESSTPAPPIKQEPSKQETTTIQPEPRTTNATTPGQIVFSVEPNPSSHSTPSLPPGQTQPESTKDTTTTPAPAPQPAGPPAPPPEPEIATRNLISVLNVELGGKNDSTIVSALPRNLKDSILVTKGSKGKRMPVKPPPPPICAVTGLNVQYRDPKTGVGYHNSYAYRQLQKVAGGGLRWSQLAGCYLGTGSAVPAAGVPEGFGKLVVKGEGSKAEKEDEAEVKEKEKEVVQID